MSLDSLLYNSVSCRVYNTNRAANSIRAIIQIQIAIETVNIYATMRCWLSVVGTSPAIFRQNMPPAQHTVLYVLLLMFTLVVRLLCGNWLCPSDYVSIVVCINVARLYLVGGSPLQSSIDRTLMRVCCVIVFSRPPPARVRAACYSIYTGARFYRSVGTQAIAHACPVSNVELSSLVCDAAPLTARQQHDEHFLPGVCVFCAGRASGAQCG